MKARRTGGSGRLVLALLCTAGLAAASAAPGRAAPAAGGTDRPASATAPAFVDEPLEPVKTGDWPQFKRDSARTGDAPEEALSFPMKRILAVRLPAPIYAAPAVVGGRAYVQDARGHVVCADIAGNKVLWVTEIGGVANHSSPAVAGGKVYVGSSAGHLAILDAASGRLLAKALGDGGVIAAPALANGAVYYAALDGSLYKIDPAGRAVWRFDGGRRSHFEFAVRGREILFLAGPPDKDPLGYTPRNRDAYRPVVLYRLRDEGERVTVAGTYATINYPTGGPVFAAGGHCALQSYVADWGAFGIFRWDRKPEGQWYSSWTGDRFEVTPTLSFTDSRAVPSVRGNRFYLLHSAGFVCLTTEPAKQIVCRSGGWPVLDAPLGHHSSPALAKDHLALGCSDGSMYFFPLAPSGTGRMPVQKAAWSYRVPQAPGPNTAVTSSPAVAGGAVFFGGEDGVLYGLGQGQEAAVVQAVPKEAPRELPGSRLKGLEWPTVRGDMGYSGVSPEAVLRPPLKVRWRTRVWGTNWGGLSVADGKVFAADHWGHVMALDAESGEVLWKLTGPPGFTLAHAVHAEGRLLVGSARARAQSLPLWCIDPATGRRLWEIMTPVTYNRSDGLAVHGGKVLGCWHDGKSTFEAAAWSLKDGQEVWRKKYDVPVVSASTDPYLRTSQGVIGDGRWYCSVGRPLSPQKGSETPPDKGATLAINPDTGQEIWRTAECWVTTWSDGLAFRKGMLEVKSGGRGVFVLDAATGKVAWSERRSNCLQPLSDEYLQSQGKAGVVPGGYCGYSVYANKVWYGNPGFSQVRTVGVREEPAAGGRTQVKEVWEFVNLSRACPPPAIAYGRLYWYANGEGVVYCFENAPAE